MRFFLIADQKAWEAALLQSWEPGYTPREVLLNASMIYTDLREINPPQNSSLNLQSWEVLTKGRAPEAVRLVQSNEIRDLMDFPLQTTSELISLLEGIDALSGNLTGNSRPAPKHLQLKTVAIF